MFGDIQIKSSSLMGAVTQNKGYRLKACRQCVQAYGWDSRTRTWYGPNELDIASARHPRLVAALKSTPGTSWYGLVSCSPSIQPASRFFTLIHDLGDCAVATLYCNESKTGPAEIVLVIPSERRSRLRSDFGFEFLAFASFLGCIGHGAEIEVTERITAAIEETSDSESLVFSISSGLWASDLDDVLGCCVEKIACAILQWLRKPQLQSHPGRRR
jgi:hypothetical protein